MISAEVLFVVIATPNATPASPSSNVRARSVRSTAASTASRPASVAVRVGASSITRLSNRTMNGSNA